MIYVAVADLIPGLHRRPELRDTAIPGPADRPRNRVDRPGPCGAAALGEKDYCFRGLRII